MPLTWASRRGCSSSLKPELVREFKAIGAVQGELLCCFVEVPCVSLIPTLEIPYQDVRPTEEKSTPGGRDAMVDERVEHGR